MVAHTFAGAFHHHVLLGDPLLAQLLSLQTHIAHRGSGRVCHPVDGGLNLLGSISGVFVPLGGRVLIFGIRCRLLHVDLLYISARCLWKKRKKWLAAG